MDDMIKDFYDKYFNCGNVFENNPNTIISEFFDKFLINNKLYKFISFDDNLILNDSKLKLLKEDKLWLSNVKYFKDNDEFNVNYDVKVMSRDTGLTVEKVEDLMKTFKELNDVCCLTTSIRDEMWEEYANNHNGICCVFTITNVDMLLPVYYCDKNKHDFTEDFITQYVHFKNKNMIKYFSCVELKRLQTLPYVMKDKMLYSKEKEVRLISSDAFDKKTDVLGGYVYPGCKDYKEYKGTAFSYEKCGLKLEKIVFGKNLDSKIKEQIKTIIPPH